MQFIQIVDENGVRLPLQHRYIEDAIRTGGTCRAILPFGESLASIKSSDNLITTKIGNTVIKQEHRDNAAIYNATLRFLQLAIHMEQEVNIATT